MNLNLTEQGNGFPQTGDIIVCHEDGTAYRVLPDVSGTGNIETRNAMRGQGNETILNVEEIDYDEHCDSADWEI